jgi:hypothetical protein
MCCFLFQGCALVHLKLFERIVEQGDRWALILEDDFFLPPHFPLLFRHAWPALPPYAASTLKSSLCFFPAVWGGASILKSPLYSEVYIADIRVSAKGTDFWSFCFWPGCGCSLSGRRKQQQVA